MTRPEPPSDALAGLLQLQRGITTLAEATPRAWWLCCSVAALVRRGGLRARAVQEAGRSTEGGKGVGRKTEIARAHPAQEGRVSFFPAGRVSRSGRVDGNWIRVRAGFVGGRKGRRAVTTESGGDTLAA